MKAPACTCDGRNTAHESNPHGHAVTCPLWGPEGGENWRRPVPVILVGGPPDYPPVHLRGSSMVMPPEVLAVALHTDALGIAEIAHGKSYQRGLWRIELYRKTKDARGAHYVWEESTDQFDWRERDASAGNQQVAKCFTVNRDEAEMVAYALATCPLPKRPEEGDRYSEREHHAAFLALSERAGKLYPITPDQGETDGS